MTIYDHEQLVTIEEVAVLTHRSTQTVKRWKASGILPPHVPLGLRGVRWRLSDIKAWIEKLQQPTPPSASAPVAVAPVPVSPGVTITPPWLQRKAE